MTAKQTLVDTCQTCRWWIDEERHASPPSVVYIPAREFRDDYGPRRDPARQETAWPRTEPYDVCGKWQDGEA